MSSNYVQTNTEGGNHLSTPVLFIRRTSLFTFDFQDRSFLIYPPLFLLTKQSLSLRTASCSNPRSIFSNCMHSDVMSVRFCLTTFQKKVIVYYFCWTQKLVTLKSDISIFMKMKKYVKSGINSSKYSLYMRSC